MAALSHTQEPATASSAVCLPKVGLGLSIYPSAFTPTLLGAPTTRPIFRMEKLRLGDKPLMTRALGAQAQAVLNAHRAPHAPSWASSHFRDLLPFQALRGQQCQQSPGGAPDSQKSNQRPHKV